MFGFFKKKKIQEDENTDTSQFMNSVCATTVNRRAQPRVRIVPGLPLTPSVLTPKGKVSPVDLSLGGMMMTFAHFEKLEVGGIYALKILWPRDNFIIPVNCELMRVSGNNYHFKFMDLDPRFRIEFQFAFKVALRAQELRMFNTDEIPPGKDIIELWLSEIGDLVMFQHPQSMPNPIGTVVCSGQRVQLDEQNNFVTGALEKGNWVFSKPASYELICEVITLLTNIKKPSLKITKLLKDWSTALEKLNQSKSA